MSRIGITLDEGDPNCKHQALGSLCGYEYCLNCSYKFFGHCTACAKRLQAMRQFFTQDLIDEFERKVKALKNRAR